MTRKKARAYGTTYIKKTRKKRKGRHSKRANPKHKMRKKYKGQGR